MADELAHNTITGKTLYSCRWQLGGNVFLSDGASEEVWVTGGRGADDYDVAMSENAPDGHYVGNFDASNNIVAGVYKAAVFLQAGGSPADSDLAVAQGEISWSGSSEITPGTLAGQGSSILNVYDERT